MPAPSFFPVLEALLRHGVPPKQASPLAMNELRSWEPAELEAIFQKVDRPDPEYCPLRSRTDEDEEKVDRVNRRPKRSQGFLRLFGGDFWISPSYESMQQAARDRRALCVNRDGRLRAMKSDYVALSHVWMEGLQRDGKRDGLALSQIRKIFDILKRAQIDAEWVWTDTLAIPVADEENACIEKEILKTDLINLMPEIYTNAKAVAIFDALVLQLKSENWMDALVLILCGKWITRVWTFQEIKLAPKALIVTANCHHLWEHVISQLLHLRNENPARYETLHTTAAILGWTGGNVLSVRDIAFACHGREAGFDIDHARAFFAVLKLKWKAGWTREEGMQEIYRSQPAEASKIAAFFGSRCMSISPMWLPSYLTGLEGRIGAALEPRDVGARGEWYVIKLLSLDHKFFHRNRILLNFIVDDERKSELQCQILKRDSSELQNITNAIESGGLYVLSTIDAAAIDREFAESAILASAMERPHSDELVAVVLCTTKLSTPPASSSHKRAVLILHESSGSEDKTRYDLTPSETEESQQEGRTAVVNSSWPDELFTATCSRDLPTILNLLRAVPPNRVFDKHGFTALHTAAARGENAILGTLLLHFSNVNIRSKNLLTATPLWMAVVYGQAHTVRFLIHKGADPNARHRPYDDSYDDNTEISPLLKAAAKDHADTVRALLGAGVDPDGGGDSPQSGTPLTTALQNNASLPTIEALIKGGASVNWKNQPEGLSPLHLAASAGSTEIVQYLLENGAVLDATDANLWTPLCHAVVHEQTGCVRLLLDAGADRNVVCGINNTLALMAVAAEDQATEILTMLLEKPLITDIPRQTDGWTPLHLAVNSGVDVAFVRKLLDAGADVLVFDTMGRTPWNVAVHSSHRTREEKMQVLVTLAPFYFSALQIESGSLDDLSAAIERIRPVI